MRRDRGWERTGGPEGREGNPWERWAEICAPRGLQVEIRSSEVTRVIGEYALGRGLFACQDFAVNEIITVYGGELISAEEARWMPSLAHLPLQSSCMAWYPVANGSCRPSPVAARPPLPSFLVRLHMMGVQRV